VVSGLGLRDELIEAYRAAGGVRSVVTGGPFEVVVEVVPGRKPWARPARRFRWQQGGTAREVIQRSSQEVCVNRAHGRALFTGNPLGSIVASDRPYSCTGLRSSVADLVVGGFVGFDAITRLAELGGTVTLTEVVDETDETDETIRHVRLRASELLGAARIPTSYDLWVDDDLRLVRADFGGLVDQDRSGPYSATFEYGGVPAITRPAAADRGSLGLMSRPGPGTNPEFADEQ
jgi:hypothetical protein